MSIKSEYFDLEQHEEDVLNSTFPKYRRIEGLYLLDDHGFASQDFFSNETTKYSIYEKQADVEKAKVVKYDKFRNDIGQKIISEIYDENEENLLFVREQSFNYALRDEELWIASDFCTDTYYPYTDTFFDDAGNKILQREMTIGQGSQPYTLKSETIWDPADYNYREENIYEDDNIKEHRTYICDDMIAKDIFRYDYSRRDRRLIEIEHFRNQNGLFEKESRELFPEGYSLPPFMSEFVEENNMEFGLNGMSLRNGLMLGRSHNDIDISKGSRQQPRPKRSELEK